MKLPLIYVMKYLVFLDYDDTPIEKVLADAKRLNEKYKLQGFEVYMSSPPNPEIDKKFPSWHVQFKRRFDNIEQVRKVINDSELCHSRFKEYANQLGFQVLRTRQSVRKSMIVKSFLVDKGVIVNMQGEIWCSIFKFNDMQNYRKVLDWLRKKLMLNRHGMKANSKRMVITIYSSSKDDAFKVGEWIRHNNPVTLETGKKLFYTVYGYENDKLIYASWCKKCRKGLGKHYEHVKK